ncbi:hypothetical protein [Oscillatoria acuminata]|uniref:Uncharacterized protein n=1 Tax=Oscillatoria acuminata PCC 6304 TaxID=56110 RepID=K9TEW3_9CYAN|nr:hypothetical protein [Oscillatoria acuminata]AFY81397.1 hypothetical protein Oscil6304_1703 [Oscillatoria acuminata PCC 6304]
MNQKLEFFTNELIKIGEAALKWEVPIEQNISIMPSGHNGPYFDIEGPLRNTAHWLVVYSILYKIYPSDKYRQIALKLSNFLKNPGIYKTNLGYVHRQKSKKDGCNGVIGHAWIAESLYRAGKYLDDEISLNLAKEIVSQLTYKPKIGLWSRLDPIKGELSIDYTYNHQAWFAAIKAEVLANEHNLDVVNFLEMSLRGGFRTRSNGLISHLYYSNSPKGKLIQLKYKLSEWKVPQTIQEKEEGYHLYVLYALARLHSIYPNHSFFDSPAFASSLKLLSERNFYNKLENNRYAFSYNAPGFEMLRIFIEFHEKFTNDYDWNWVIALYHKQTEKTYSEHLDLHTRGEDSFTLAARVYELAIGIEAAIEKC